MNIHAKRGDLVTVTEESIKNGHDWEKAKELLEVGKIYTIDHTIVGDWHTEVYLQEFPEKVFNSVNFEDPRDARHAPEGLYRQT